jgi:outer membrane autotransporter protein
MGQRAYGAYAVDGAEITLENTSITTHGFMAYGIYAREGGVITANNLNITTYGQVGDAAWAYDGGILNINGGQFIVHGEPNPGTKDEMANGLLAFKGGVINADGLTIITYGSDSAGIRAGALLGEGGDPYAGKVTFSNGSITVEGENSVAALVRFGSTVEITDSTLVSKRGVGIATVDNAEVTLENTTVSAAKASISANFTKAGQEQTITIGGGSVLTENNGTLLIVTREDAGKNGKLTLELQANSIASGDVIDNDFDDGGGTVFIVNEGAQWSGTLEGTISFISKSGSKSNFGDGSKFVGDLEGDGSSYVFGENVTINGNVELNKGSTTTGGSINSPVQVTGDVTVDDTSFLGGNWDIDGDLKVDGTLSPGNSMGKVTTHGKLTLGHDSKTHIEIFANGDSDQIKVDNDAQLNGTLIITAVDGVKLNEAYTILTAGKITGQFDQPISWDRPYFFLEQPQVSYISNDDPKEVQLTITRNNLNFASAALSANETAVANAAEQLDNDNPIFNAILISADQNAARQAFASLSGEVHPSTLGVLIDDSRFVRDSANARLRAALDGNSAGTGALVEQPLSDRLAFWARAFGSWADRNSTGNTASIDSTHGGVIFGSDVPVSRDFRVGLLAGFEHTDVDVDGRLSSASSDSYSLGLYAGWSWNAFALRIGGAYSWHDIDMHRTVVVNNVFFDSAKADYDAATTQIFGEAGYRVGNAATYFEPFVGIAHVNIAADDFTEEGGDAALTARSSTHDTTFTTAGVRAQTAVSFGPTELTLRGELGWRHAFGDVTPVSQLSFAGHAPFAIAGAPLARDALIIGAGFDLAMTGNAKLEVAYDGQVGDGVQQHGVTARLGWRF